MSSTTPLAGARAPIIMLGMHRSGTAMISRMLEQLGLFVGNRLDENHEAIYFTRINQMVFARAHAAWDHPQGVRQFLACRPAVDLTATALAADLRTYRIGQYLGWRRWLRNPSIEHWDFPWGWKDPRNVFTLPLWLRLFPQARIIHIVRHGLDVARSLLVREQQMLARRQEKSAAQMARRGRRSYLERAGFKGSARCLTIEGGFALWEKYLLTAEQTLGEISNPRLCFRYEDFLADPRQHLCELVKFCQLGECSEEKIAQVAQKADSSRSLAYATDPAITAFVDQMKDNAWLERFGYLGEHPNSPAATPNKGSGSISSSPKLRPMLHLQHLRKT